MSRCTVTPTLQVANKLAAALLEVLHALAHTMSNIGVKRKPRYRFPPARPSYMAFVLGTLKGWVCNQFAKISDFTIKFEYTPTPQPRLELLAVAEWAKLCIWIAAIFGYKRNPKCLN